MIFLGILLISLVAVVGVALHVSRTIEHGEAQFDVNRKAKPNEDKQQSDTVTPASRKTDT